MFKLAAERPVPAAILGAFTIAFSAILVRLADVSPETAAAFRCLYALPLLGVIAWSEDRRFGARQPRDRKIAAIAGLFFGADLILWHYAIEAVGAGLATVLANLQVVMVGFIAWVVLSERPPLKTVVSAPIALLGVVLISGIVGSGEAYGDNPRLGVIFGILTALAYSGFLLVLRRSSADLRRPAGPLFDATAVAAVAIIGYGLAVGKLDLVPSWPSHLWLIGLAVTSQVFGWLLITSSLPRLPAALTSVLLTIQPLGSVVLGVLILDEHPGPLQVVGVGAVVIAVVTATARRPRTRVAI